MKRYFVAYALMICLGCAKKSSDPGIKVLSKMNRAILSEQTALFLDTLTPQTVSEFATRIGLGAGEDKARLLTAMALQPGSGYEKLSLNTPKLIPDRAGADERWYEVVLSGRKAVLPVRLIEGKWLVALNEVEYAQESGVQ